MKKLRILIIAMLVFVMGSVSSFATTTIELQDKLNQTESEVNTSITTAKNDLLNRLYPVGSIYTTSEDISASDMHDMFGGSWQRMTNTFLWAAMGDEEIGTTGGARFYNFSAMLGPAEDDDELAYIGTGLSQYMLDHTPNFNLKSGFGSFEQGTFSGSIPVTEGDNDTIEIMPKYTAVRMFKRIS